MEFEFDPEKSVSNKRKHGIDFEEAQLLWVDPDRLEIPAKTKEEPRFVLIGSIQEKKWTAVFTYREEKIRLISVRHSRKEEVYLYEG